MVFAGKAGGRGRDSLRLRMVSAAVGVPVLLAFILAGELWTLALVIAIAALGMLEFYQMTGACQLWPWRLPGLVLGIALVVAGWYQQTLWLPGAVALSLPLMYLSYRGTPHLVRPWLASAAGPLYLGSTLAHAVLIRGLDQGASWMMLTILVTFSVDTSAYAIGRSLGRHRMAPKLSPGKTWEGAAAGLMGGISAAVLLASLFSFPLAAWKVMFLGAGIGVAAQVGDLIESAIKRAAGAKEAGWLIPGHGGILDRLDSVVLSLVVVYYGVTW